MVGTNRWTVGTCPALISPFFLTFYSSLFISPALSPFFPLSFLLTYPTLSSFLISPALSFLLSLPFLPYFPDPFFLIFPSQFFHLPFLILTFFPSLFFLFSLSVFFLTSPLPLLYVCPFLGIGGSKIFPVSVKWGMNEDYGRSLYIFC